jgi:hypothetical protein
MAMLNMTCYNNLEVITMSVKVDQFTQEVQQLPHDELIALYKAIVIQLATPLRDPKEMYDDWDNLEVDKAYAQLW